MNVLNDFRWPAVDLALDARELEIARKAMDVYHGFYVAFHARETDPKDKVELAAYVAKAETLRARVAPTIPMTRGDFASFDRALRMLMNHYHERIKPSMTADEKAALRIAADEAASLLTRIRRLQGLP